MPDTRGPLEKFATFITIGLGKRIIWFYRSNFYERGRRFLGLESEAKSVTQTFWETVTGKANKNKNFSVFRNPITGTKEAMKWLAVKLFAAILVIKIVLGNVHHLFAPRAVSPSPTYT